MSWKAWISYDQADRGPWWLAWLWTLLFAVVIAAFFTFLGFFAFASGESAWRNLSGWATWYGRNFIVSLTIAAAIHLLFELGRVTVAIPARVVRWAPWQRTLYFSGVPLTGLLLAWPLGLMLAGQSMAVWVGSRNGNSIVLGSIVFSLGITFVLHHFFAAKTRQYQAERNATEAHLRLLQAQIEPHFLFNTLANVSALIEDDAPKAREMLDTFTDYLRASLASLRHADTALAAELDLVGAYLNLLKMRMGDRLRFRIEVADEVRALRLPPLLLQPLVENAVHHGLEAQVDGGTVCVSARLEGRVLTLTVADDGRGLDAPPRTQHTAGRGGTANTGLALQNLRERLQARYGARASLDLVASEPGTRATIRLPLDPQTLDATR